MDNDNISDFDQAARDGDTLGRLRALFDMVVDLPNAERQAWISENVRDAEERAALGSLLAADDGNGFLDTPIDEHAARLAPEEITRAEGLIGQQIGAFRIVRLLGKGGMAAVFLGERVGRDFQQRIALKMLRRGLYSDLEQRLFLRERQVLAGLSHPNIASMIDGGVTEAGIPYLVMEYIDGLPITDYANAQHLGVIARLRLFLTVCRAVETAHRNLIVHRDIKPSNILVDAQGTVKLLDFGIAKLIEEDTEGATVGVFTPGYAAPEQVSGGNITTATDVYGMGVLLHELLIGRRPDGNPPRRPSTLIDAHLQRDGASGLLLRKQLRGDLDNIVLKALAAEPAQRYPSAGALAEDIERFLDHRPVRAHPPSRLYRARKFIVRHRGGVSITSILVLSILASLALALWQAKVARREAERANTVRDFVVGIFDAARAHLPREQRPTPELLVAQAEQRLKSATSLDAGTRSDMLRTLGEVSLSLSNFARAEAAFAQARTLATQRGDVPAARSLQVLHADALQRAGRNDDALREVNEVLDPLRAAPTPILLRALTVLAAAETLSGQPDPAIAHLREAATSAQAQFGADSTEAISAGFEVGIGLAKVQRYAEALTVLDPLLAAWRAGHAPEDDRYVAALTSAATAEDDRGDQAASETRFRELLALKRKIYTGPHDAIAQTLEDLGAIVMRSEKYAESEALLNEALVMQRQVLGEDHEQTASTYSNLGSLMLRQRKYADADNNFRTAIAICDRAGIKTDICPRARNNLGQSLYMQTRYDEAKQEMTAALQQRRALYGEDHPDVAQSMATLANIADAQGDHAEAVRLSGAALAIFDRDGHANTPEAALTRNGYAKSLWLAERNDDALREINRALIDWQRVSPNGRVRHVMMLVLKAQIQVDLKQPEESRQTADEAIAIGANASEIPSKTRQLLRELSGRSDVYPEPAPAAPAK